MRAELDKLGEGTPEFAQQAAVVKGLNTEVAQAKQKILNSQRQSPSWQRAQPP